MADAGDSKSPDRKGREGSTPSSGTTHPSDADLGGGPHSGSMTTSSRLILQKRAGSRTVRSDS